MRALQTPSKVNRHCLNAFPDRRDFNYCKETGDAAPEVVFLGDSRTQAVYDAMVSLSYSTHPMLLLARSGCPAVLSLQVPEPGSDEESCNRAWWDFVKAVRSLQPRLVVLVGGGSDLVAEPPSGTRFEDELSQLIRVLQQTSKVVYVRETPEFETGPDCFLRPVKVPWGACTPVLPRAVIEERLKAYNHAVDEIQARFPALVVVSTIQALCGSKYCAQELSSGELLYRDRLHLTTAGARRLDKGSGLYALIDSEIRVSLGDQPDAR